MKIEMVPEVQLQNLEHESSPREKPTAVSPRAYEISGNGNYKEIESRLSQENLLTKEVLRVHERYGRALENEPWMTDHDWEMLAIMDCYDEHTAHHCVETLRIAKEKIDFFKAGDKKFSQLIEAEGVPLQEFFRACLFHDIGKCAIPRSILNNTFFDADFDSQLCKEVFDEGNTEYLARIEKVTGHVFEGIKDTKTLHGYLREHNVHTMRYIPAIKILSEEDLTTVKERFPHLDLSQATLADILEFHEENSEKILIDQGFEIAASIAGKHHNYRNLKMRFPISTSVLNVSITLEELLTLSDIEQALSSKRSYKEKLEMPSLLSGLIAETGRHNINPAITSLWVEQEISRISGEDRAGYNKDEILALGNCEKFVHDHQVEIDEFIGA